MAKVNAWKKSYYGARYDVIRINYAEEVGGCCATYCIAGFPIDKDDVDNRAAAVRELVNRITEHEGIARGDDLDDYGDDWNCSIIVATTNSNQKVACSALKKCGFTSTEWASRKEEDGHGTKVKLWYKLLNA